MARMIDVRTADYRELYENFRWTIPPFYNIGLDVCDRHAAATPGALAIFSCEEEAWSLTAIYVWVKLKICQTAWLTLSFTGVAPRGIELPFFCHKCPKTESPMSRSIKSERLPFLCPPCLVPTQWNTVPERFRCARAIITDANGSSRLRGNSCDRLPALEHVYVIAGKAGAGELDFERELEDASPGFHSYRDARRRSRS